MSFASEAKTGCYFTLNILKVISLVLLRSVTKPTSRKQHHSSLSSWLSEIEELSRSGPT